MHQSTVAEVYENILADLETALELNSLPDKPINTMRVGKAFAYAVKAKALMSMLKFPEALEAAEASLAINDFIYDQRQLTRRRLRPAAHRLPGGSLHHVLRTSEPARLYR